MDDENEASRNMLHSNLMLRLKVLFDRLPVISAKPNKRRWLSSFRQNLDLKTTRFAPVEDELMMSFRHRCQTWIENNFGKDLSPNNRSLRTCRGRVQLVHGSPRVLASVM